MKIRNTALFFVCFAVCAVLAEESETWRDTLSSVFHSQNGETLSDAMQASPETKSAFNVVSSDVCAAVLLLINTFGRVAVASYLGYKSYESILDALRKDEKRNEYIVQAVCYVGASVMLLYDGYRWMLHQGTSA
jgi:hypothetical protein